LTRKVIVICDRCQRTLADQKDLYMPIEIPFLSEGLRHNYDLCRECWNSLYLWITSHKEKHK